MFNWKSPLFMIYIECDICPFHMVRRHYTHISVHTEVIYIKQVECIHMTLKAPRQMLISAIYRHADSVAPDQPAHQCGLTS